MLMIKKKDHLMDMHGVGKATFMTSECPLIDCESTISRFTPAAAREHLTNDHGIPLSAVETVLSLIVNREYMDISDIGYPYTIYARNRNVLQKYDTILFNGFNDASEMPSQFPSHLHARHTFVKV